MPPVVVGRDGVASAALSVDRLDEELGFTTCAGLVVLEASSASIRRDVAALIIGALFSIAVGVMLESFRRERKSGSD